MADLVKLDILDFDVVLSLHKLHACYASFYCTTVLIKFQFPNDQVLDLKRNLVLPKGLILYLFRANDSSFEVPPI